VVVDPGLIFKTAEISNRRALDAQPAINHAEKIMTNRRANARMGYESQKHYGKRKPQFTLAVSWVRSGRVQKPGKPSS
jgi:hypothetical protein